MLICPKAVFTTAETKIPHKKALQGQITGPALYFTRWPARRANKWGVEAKAFALMSPPSDGTQKLAAPKCGSPLVEAKKKGSA